MPANWVRSMALPLVVVVLALLCFRVFLPFLDEILWSIVGTILFLPVKRWYLARNPGQENRAALVALAAMSLTLLLPMGLLLAVAIDQVAALYQGLASGRFNPASALESAVAHLPDSVRGLLARAGLGDFEAIQSRVVAGLGRGMPAFANQALAFGGGVLNVLLSLIVILYLGFFFLRDGEKLVRRMAALAPIDAGYQAVIDATFVTVVRATVKGGIFVALAQGAVGGAVLALLGIESWLLLGLVMAVAALLPAVGTGLVWLPVALYLLATGQVIQAVILVLCGLFVIGMVDNILRPILIGSETKMPDFIVLLSTLGGVEAFGFDGLLVGPLVAALAQAVFTRLLDRPEAAAPPAP
ncbi:AI-2E family transporter [Sphingomonas sp. HT-1]|uniref:AI-2E family transporter n=1 Tax=unclassified Sphingomonas TaxID=196159 RepID=UPI0003073E44|nr:MULTISPECIES: AI-2E family transporter [unclassified Sphingomonas]